MSRTYHAIAILPCLVGATGVQAQIQVDPPFEVELYATTPYGAPVVLPADSPFGGDLLVMRRVGNDLELAVLDDGIESRVIPAVLPLASADVVRDLDVDHAGLFLGGAFITWWDLSADRGRVHRVSAEGVVTEVWTQPSNVNLQTTFSSGAGDFEAGAWFRDTDLGGGEAFWFASPGSTSLTQVTGNIYPPGRSDLDVYDLDVASTARYGFQLAMADHDSNQNQRTGVYLLSRSFAWTELTETSSNSRLWYAVEFSPGGALGDQLYVADGYAETIYALDPDGTLTPFATASENIDRIAITPCGGAMYVVGSEGRIYRIFDPTLITADLNGNDTIDFADLLILLGAWGACVDCPADLDGSGAVDFADLLQLIGLWGTCGAHGN